MKRFSGTYIEDLQNKPFLYFILFFGFSILLYLREIDNYFVEDTLTGFTLDWRAFFLELTSPGVVVGYRPGLIGFFLINYALWGREPLAFNIISILLHATTCWLIFMISLKVTGKTFVALVAAIVFLFNPVHVEAIVLTTANFCTIASTLIGLFGCWIWVKHPDFPEFKTKILVAAIYFFALLFKESIIVIPGFLILLDLGMNRIPVNAGIKKTLKYFFNYWPFAVVLTIYSLIYIYLGIFSDSMSYANYSGNSASGLVAIGNDYARAMFMPFSTFIEWRTGSLGFVWLILLIFIMHLNKKSLWAFLWIFVGFLTLYSRFQYRATYLPMVGFAFAFAILADGLYVWAEDRTKMKVLATFLKSFVVTIILIYMILSYRSIQRELQSWEVASKLTWEIPRKAKQLVTTIPANAEMTFIGVPEYYGNAHVYGWGLVDETRYVFNMSELTVNQVVEANHGYWRIKLQDIPAKSDKPRYFFYFNPVSLEIDRVDINLPGTDFVLK